MTVTTPPRRPEVDRDRELEQRVADLEALIEEARRRARRRQAGRGIAALVLFGAGVVAYFGFGGHGGGGPGTAALAHDSHGTAVNTGSPQLGALPTAAGAAEAFAFDPDRKSVV